MEYLTYEQITKKKWKMLILFRTVGLDCHLKTTISQTPLWHL